jgi:hypothetical protein
MIEDYYDFAANGRGCDVAFAGLAAPDGKAMQNRQIRPTSTARNALPQPASATKTRKGDRSHRNSSSPALPIPLKSPPFMDAH